MVSCRPYAGRVVAACFLIGFPLLPRDASAHGPALDQHLWLNLEIACALLVLAHLILLSGFLLRKRRVTGRGPLTSALVEYVPLAALAVLFAFLTFRAERLWAATRYVGANPADLQVEVTGMQFAWYFRYPGRDAVFGRTKPTLVAAAEGNPLGLDPADPEGADDIVSSELVLPVGREVDIRLHSLDVIHGFAVPELRLKQNAVPGESIHIHFTPVITGTYAIMCTQLCGLGHYRMAARLRVVSPAEFAQWLQAHQPAVAS
jgi:cytochrome c oxidase subunit 2